MRLLQKSLKVHTNTTVVQYYIQLAKSLEGESKLWNVVVDAFDKLEENLINLKEPRS